MHFKCAEESVMGSDEILGLLMGPLGALNALFSVFSAFFISVSGSMQVIQGRSSANAGTAPIPHCLPCLVSHHNITACCASRLVVSLCALPLIRTTLPSANAA